VVGPGKLVLSEPPASYVPSRLRGPGRKPGSRDYGARSRRRGASALAWDPFDRVLVAQAQLLNMTIVTADPAVAQYEVDSILI